MQKITNTNNRRYGQSNISSNQIAARQHLRLHLKRIRQREYAKLRAMVPAVAEKKSVSKVTVIEEAVKYIDQLHRALAQRLQTKKGFQNTDINEHNVKYLVQHLMAQQMAMTDQPSHTPSCVRVYRGNPSWTTDSHNGVRRKS